MIGRIFPKQFDNASWRGHWLAIWFLVPLLLVKAVQGVNSIVLTRMVATNTDGIPIDRYGAAGAQTVLALFALLGLYGLLLPLLSAVALIRYRAMIPLVYLMFLFVQLGSRILLLVQPIERASAMPIGLPINLAILAFTLVGFAFSLVERRPD
jgi:hypothetical protein